MRQLGDVTSTEEDRFLSDYLSQKRWKDKLSFNAAATSPVQEDSEDEKLLDEVYRLSFALCPPCTERKFIISLLQKLCKEANIIFAFQRL